MLIVNKVGVKDELICHKFIQALPLEVRPIIAAVKNAMLIELGILVDKIMLLAKTKSISRSSTKHNQIHKTYWCHSKNDIQHQTFL